MTSPLDLIHRFGELRALVVGDAMLDSYLEGTASRLCTEGPVPVVTKTGEERSPGGAANTATNLRALGAHVNLLGVTGADEAGAHLRAALQGCGVDSSLLLQHPSASTLHKLRVLANGQYVVRFDEGDTRGAAPEVHQRLMAALVRAWAECEVVVVSDYRYGVLSDGLIGRLAELQRRDPRVLLVDSKDLARWRDTAPTVVTPNHHEAQTAVGWEGDASGAMLPADAEEVGRRLIELTGAGHAAITMAAQGVLVVGPDGALHLPAHPVAHPSDVGAGDSFAAAMALALASGGEPAVAAQLGLDAAAIAVSRERTAVVGHRELLRAVGTRLQAEGESPARIAYRAVEEARAAGRTVLFTNGVFDILHAGHVGFLRRARALGDVLVVGVNTDTGARRLKGAGRPVNPERDRLALVAALDSVDHALLFDEDTPAQLIRALRPHIHVKGGDYADGPLPEAGAVEEVGGRVVILPLIEGRSTSGMIERIAALGARSGN